MTAHKRAGDELTRAMDSAFAMDKMLEEAKEFTSTQP